MTFTARVKRIGGSTYLLVPPQVARRMALEDGQSLEADLERPKPTAAEILETGWGLDPDAQYFDRKAAWPDRKLRGEK